MLHPDLISITELVAATNYAYHSIITRHNELHNLRMSLKEHRYDVGSIDHPSLMAKTKVWIYSGTQDTVVVQGMCSW